MAVVSEFEHLEGRASESEGSEGNEGVIFARGGDGGVRFDERYVLPLFLVSASVPRVVLGPHPSLMADMVSILQFAVDGC